MKIERAYDGLLCAAWIWAIDHLFEWEVAIKEAVNCREISEQVLMEYLWKR